jgi:hypothetical protein
LLPEASREVTTFIDDEVLPVVATTAPDYEVTPKAAEGLARRMVDLIAAGAKPEDAILASGGAPNMLKNPALREAVARLNALGNTNAELQRAVLRGLDFDTYLKLNSAGIAALEKDGDASILKEAAGYSKMIRSDPAVGLNAPPVQINVVDIQPVKPLLERLGEAAVEFQWSEDEETK